MLTVVGVIPEFHWQWWLFQILNTNSTQNGRHSMAENRAFPGLYSDDVGLKKTNFDRRCRWFCFLPICEKRLHIDRFQGFFVSSGGGHSTFCCRILWPPSRVWLCHRAVPIRRKEAFTLCNKKFSTIAAGWSPVNFCKAVTPWLVMVAEGISWTLDITGRWKRLPVGHNQYLVPIGCICHCLYTRATLHSFRNKLWTRP